MSERFDYSEFGIVEVRWKVEDRKGGLGLE